jgi:hypothetical protein
LTKKGNTKKFIVPPADRVELPANALDSQGVPILCITTALELRDLLRWAERYPAYMEALRKMFNMTVSTCWAAPCAAYPLEPCVIPPP